MKQVYVRKNVRKSVTEREQEEPEEGEALLVGEPLQCTRKYPPEGAEVKWQLGCVFLFLPTITKFKLWQSMKQLSWVEEEVGKK